jgi:hypothetical protein
MISRTHCGHRYRVTTTHGRLRGYVEIQPGHALHGNTNIAEIQLVLDCPHINYARGGAMGFWIGVAGGECEDITELRCKRICRQLSEFTPRPARLDLDNGKGGFYSMRLA